jgi:tetratricopeptide (TPR) repeat protein
MYPKINIGILFIVILLFVGCEPSVKDGLSYDEYVKLVYSYSNEGDYDRAIAAGKNAVRIQPTDGEAHYLLAMTYRDAYDKSFDDAQRKRIVTIIENPRKQYNNEDWVKEYKKYGLRPELNTLATQEFEETVRYSPSNWFAHYMIATNNFNNKQFRDAIDGYKKVIALNPKYVNSYSLMGEAYSELGEYSQAIQYLHTAVKMDPKGTYTLLSLGRVYKKMEDWGQAAAIKKQLIDMKASYGDL